MLNIFDLEFLSLTFLGTDGVYSIVDRVGDTDPQHYTAYHACFVHPSGSTVLVLTSDFFFQSTYKFIGKIFFQKVGCKNTKRRIYGKIAIIYL